MVQPHLSHLHPLAPLRSSVVIVLGQIPGKKLQPVKSDQFSYRSSCSIENIVAYLINMPNVKFVLKEAGQKK